jgi:hypothetical protein
VELDLEAVLAQQLGHQRGGLVDAASIGRHGRDRDQAAEPVERLVADDVGKRMGRRHARDADTRAALVDG